ncbi:serine threonine kinase [Pyrenophora seminiperda CCB06]|uniref:Serine threonine kinase n=1 Tax=Pyrenophora seminiperda CCB06 TaxID=1302712 RepID=A0A3M7MGY7_9PLEO|nr:serine threonine kinase [Pyrenophora seminiperda CCB06]
MARIDTGTSLYLMSGRRPIRATSYNTKVTIFRTSLTFSVNCGTISKKMTSKAANLPACDHTSSDGLSGEADTKPQGPIVNIIEGKGEFLGGGATGLVERLDSGDVVKSPWTGRPTASDCKQEIAIEAQIYERLGVHPRLVQFKRWDPASHTLTLEYMPNGNLKEYI